MDVKIDIDQSSVSKASHDIDKYLGLVTDIAGGVIEATAITVKEEIQATTAYTDRTGLLRKSAFATGAEHVGKEIQSEFGETMEYGPFLEFGTTRMAARPHVEPAIPAGRKFFEANIKKAFDTAAKKSKRTT